MERAFERYIYILASTTASSRSTQWEGGLILLQLSDVRIHEDGNAP